tara:strand:+ start:86 stop:1609 length:1524 start_codon:yes stop_codon:yes gene_type:complete
MQDLIENKPKIFSRNTIICLGIIGAVGFLIRFFYFPEGIPITLDGTLYFWYANDLGISGIFPSNVNVPNNGWPTFLSVFFYFFNSENFLDYMVLQRYVTVTISVITIIPIFILCRKFCGNGLSLFGALLFVFQPRIVENSLSGLTDPLFILLELTCLVLFLQNNFKLKYLSFAFLALACLVRYEGMVLIIPLSVLFLLANGINKKNIPRYLIAISIFLLVLLPMAFVRMDTMGYDGVTSHSIAAVSAIGKNSTMYLGINSFMTSVAFGIFPIFFALLPLGFFGFFRNRSFDKYTVLLFLIFMLIPVIYASSRGITEPRYLLVLFPIFSLISVYTVKEIIKKFNKSKLISIMFVTSILVLSIVYLDYNKNDYDYELDVYHVGLEVSKRTSVINDYHPEVKYIHNKIDVASHLGTFPVLSSEIKQKVKLIETSGFNSLNEFIDYGKNEGLMHIVTDKNENRQQFLKNVFKNEEKFPYLIKIYDSVEQGYDYHLKIFRIDYEKFESMEFN